MVRRPGTVRSAAPSSQCAAPARDQIEVALPQGRHEWVDETDVRGRGGRAVDCEIRAIRPSDLIARRALLRRPAEPFSFDGSVNPDVPEISVDRAGAGAPRTLVVPIRRSPLARRDTCSRCESSQSSPPQTAEECPSFVRVNRGVHVRTARGGIAESECARAPVVAARCWPLPAKRQLEACVRRSVRGVSVSYTGAVWGAVGEAVQERCA
jgi:hypothetical protein